MKKKLIIISIAFVLSFICSLYLNSYKTNENLTLENQTQKMVTMERTLTMMLETDAGSGDYEMVTQSDWPTDGYVFNETLSKCENGGELSWDDTNKQVVMTGIVSDKCYVYFDVAQLQSLADYIKNSIYTGTQGENGLYYHDGTLENGINDGSYRYAGASADVDNYVCISDEETCSDANLFRIIGVFDEGVKLIRANPIESRQWNGTLSNTWSSASLNTYLNGEYLTSLGDFATNYIATSTWKVGGNTWSNIGKVVPATAYTNEITSPVADTKHNAKIGLMYVSDYGFGAAHLYWSKSLYDEKNNSNDYRLASSSNWLYFGSEEWLITPVSDYSEYAFMVYSEGCIVLNGYLTIFIKFRPVFYLKPTVKYVKGTGESGSPIRLG